MRELEVDRGSSGSVPHQTRFLRSRRKRKQQFYSFSSSVSFIAHEALQGPSSPAPSLPSASPLFRPQGRYTWIPLHPATAWIPLQPYPHGVAPIVVAPNGQLGFEFVYRPRPCPHWRAGGLRGRETDTRLCPYGVCARTHMRAGVGAGPTLLKGRPSTLRGRQSRAIKMWKISL